MPRFGVVCTALLLLSSVSFRPSYREVVTLGMRGPGDTPMSATANTQLLEPESFAYKARPGN